MRDLRAAVVAALVLVAWLAAAAPASANHSPSASINGSVTGAGEMRVDDAGAGGSDRFPCVATAASPSDTCSNTYYATCRDTADGEECEWPTVNLAAVPAAGWSFTGWGGDCSGTGTCAVVPTANVTATFERDTAGPTVALGVTDNQLFKATRWWITASASDPSGVAKVEFLVDGTKRAESTSPFSAGSYRAAVELGDVSDGSHTLVARAYDTLGNSSDSSRTILVDGTAPALSLDTTPSGRLIDGTHFFAGSMTFDAGFTDANGIGSIAMWTGPTATTVPWQWDFSGEFVQCRAPAPATTCRLRPSSTTTGSGSFYLRVQGYDRAGNMRERTLRVQIDRAAPAVSMDDPGSPLKGNVIVSAPASDTGGSGVASVRFERAPADSSAWAEVCTDTTAPFACIEDTTKLANGLYAYRAVATDGIGNSRTSAAVEDRLVENPKPVAPADTKPPVPSIVGSTLSVRKGAAPLKLKCPAAEQTCAFTVKLTAPAGVRGVRKGTSLGTGKLTVAGGATKAVTVKLTAKGRTAVKWLRKLKALATVSARDAAGNTGSAKKTVTLKFVK